MANCKLTPFFYGIITAFILPYLFTNENTLVLKHIQQKGTTILVKYEKTPLFDITKRCFYLHIGFNI